MGIQDLVEMSQIPPDARAERFERISERQRIYLRHVFQHRKSEEIAHLEGASARAVDKQLLLAKDIIGANSRFEAARLFAEYEAGVEGFYPASVAPSQRAFWPLPLPVPTKSQPFNALTWQQVLAWGAIIMVAAPIAVTVCTMVIITLRLLVGGNPL
jgi:DNA-binding CsgD family transcriptional regulator